MPVSSSGRRRRVSWHQANDRDTASKVKHTRSRLRDARSAPSLSWRPEMFALAYRIVGNRADAEGIVQDAFVAPAMPRRRSGAFAEGLSRDDTSRLSLTSSRPGSRRDLYRRMGSPNRSGPRMIRLRAKTCRSLLMAVLHRPLPGEPSVRPAQCFDLTFERSQSVVSAHSVTCARSSSALR